MITEIAELNIQEDRREAFEEGVRRAVPLFRRAKGCFSMALKRMEEEPGRYQLVVGWKNLEDHTVYFRQSEDFQEWRSLVGQYFVEPPVVCHWHEVATYFD